LVRRLRVFSFFITLALVVSACLGFWLATWPGFDPQAVTVIGNVHISAAEVRKLARIPMDRNVWLLDKRAAEARIEALPWVRVAQIHRKLPGVVWIIVHERTPAACVRSRDAAYLVDEQGHVIETNCMLGHDLVEIDWPDLARRRPGDRLQAAVVRRLLEDAGTLHAQGLDPLRVGLDRFGGLDATLRGGLRLLIGDDRDVARKASLVEPILQAYGGRTAGIAAIDLRAPSTPVVEERRP
jgi:cell division septal protein FtsQ